MLISILLFIFIFIFIIFSDRLAQQAVEYRCYRNTVKQYMPSCRHAVAAFFFSYSPSSASKPARRLADTDHGQLVNYQRVNCQLSTINWSTGRVTAAYSWPLAYPLTSGSRNHAPLTTDYRLLGETYSCPTPGHAIVAQTIHTPRVCRCVYAATHPMRPRFRSSLIRLVAVFWRRCAAGPPSSWVAGRRCEWSGGRMHNIIYYYLLEFIILDHS